MSRLKQLYQEMILEHNRNPRNFNKLNSATCKVHGKNPLCGDDYNLYIEFDKDDNLVDLGFEGSGCAISKSSGSIMTSTLKNKSKKEASEIKDAFIELLMTDKNEKTKSLSAQHKVFEGVKQYPARVKCATLIWRALERALENPNSDGDVSTE